MLGEGFKIVIPVMETTTTRSREAVDGEIGRGTLEATEGIHLTDSVDDLVDFVTLMMSWVTLLE